MIRYAGKIEKWDKNFPDDDYTYLQLGLLSIARSQKLIMQLNDEIMKKIMLNDTNLAPGQKC